MHLCPNCAIEMIPGAKFCHRCGDKVVEKTKTCPACEEQNPLVSVFCHHCGFHFEGKKHRQPAYQPLFPFKFEQETLTDQVKTMFFRNLRHRVAEEHDLAQYDHYVDRFYHSNFRDIYNVRSQQIAGEVWKRWQQFGKEGLPDIDRRVEEAFEGLLDFFIIQHCPDLNGLRLPEAILRYERARAEQVDMAQMIRDFLDYEQEEEVFYLDFVVMPPEMLSNACKNFLFAGRKEKVYVICDLSLRGSCKEGFALTDQGLYWRMPFDKARQALYGDVRELKKNKEHLLIDGHFFTSNPSLNLKIFKLLKKLRSWKTIQAPVHAV